jgi:hypothetical protein
MYCLALGQEFRCALRHFATSVRPVQQPLLRHEPEAHTPKPQRHANRLSQVAPLPTGHAQLSAETWGARNPYWTLEWLYTGNRDAYAKNSHAQRSLLCIWAEQDRVCPANY